MTKARDLHKAKVMDVCFTCAGRLCRDLVPLALQIVS